MKSYYLRIPMRQIQSNPENPRRVITQEMVDQKKASLKADGQLTPVKLQPLSAAEHTTGPEQAYMILGGELRYRAAKELGWDALDALVIEGATPEEAELVSLMDNKGQDMHWLDWYQAIEKWVSSHPGLNQTEIAAQLEMNQSDLSRALKTLQYLNGSSRDQIYAVCINSKSEDALQIGKNVALVLSDLEDADQVERALKVAIERQLTEAQAKSLVSWIKKSNSPESFGEKVAKNPALDPTDPYGSLWKDLPPNTRVIMGKTGYELRLKLAPSQAPTAVYSALAAIEHLKETALLPDSPPADPRFAQALPDLATEGRRIMAMEQGLQMAQAEEKRKIQEAKDQRKAQKAAAKEQARALKAQKAEGLAQAQAQKAAQKREAFENSKFDAKTHLETAFGPSPLAEGIYQKALAGEKASVLKTVKTTLPVIGKSPEEQEAFMKDFKIKLTRLSRLNPNKPAPSPRKSALGKEGLKVPAGNPLPEMASSAPAEPVTAAQPHTPGLFDIVKGAVEKVGENLESGSLLGTLANMALKNAKQTVNYEERKGMRHLFNDIL
jgi:ParB family transcriptional regulator, chromosome partitioning protein